MSSSRPASDLRDQNVSLETIWGPAVRHLRAHLLSASTPHAKFRALDAALRAQLTTAEASSFVNEAVEVTGMTRYRIEDGTVREERGLVDNLGLMSQLGAGPE